MLMTSPIGNITKLKQTLLQTFASNSSSTKTLLFIKFHDINGFVSSSIIMVIILSILINSHKDIMYFFTTNLVKNLIF